MARPNRLQQLQETGMMFSHGPHDGAHQLAEYTGRGDQLKGAWESRADAPDWSVHAGSQGWSPNRGKRRPSRQGAQHSGHVDAAMDLHGLVVFEALPRYATDQGVCIQVNEMDLAMSAQQRTQVQVIAIASPKNAKS